MITTMGYSGSSSIGFGSPLKLRSSLLVTSRRPSIPLSPTLLPLVSFSSHEKSVEGKPSVACTPALVHQLPVEILCDIFIYCHSGASGEACGPKVAISHVSRRWRAIILCMPLLWTTAFTRNPTLATIDRLAAYFRRAGDCPISISVVEDLAFAPSQALVFQRLWALIRACASRLKIVRLELEGSSKGLVEQLSGCRFPMLENLSLRLHSSSSSSVDEVMSLFHQTGISSLSWHCFRTLPNNTPWAQLLRLELRGDCALGTIYSALQHCRNVRELVLDSITDAGNADVQQSTILPLLESLAISTVVDLSVFFDRISLPALRTLDIHLRLKRTETRPWRALGTMLSRSTCELQKLVLWDKTTSDDAFLQLLLIPSVQSISALHIHFPSISDNVLHALTPVDRGACCPLPALQTLHLLYCHSSDGTLKDAIAARTDTSAQQYAKLKDLLVGLKGNHKMDEVYLQSLVNDMAIRIHNRGS